MKSFLFSLCLVTFVAASACADSSGRIYGRITTDDGETFEGLIRWDKNEGSWCDILNGNKELRDGHRARRHDRIRIFGITIGEREGRGEVGMAQSGLSFGHLKSLEVIDDDAARLVLKSGEKVTLEGGSTDIGEDIREIIIEDAKEGEIGLDWDDIELIEFSQGPVGLSSAFGERMYGTLKTRDGDEFTGWASWDVDELFAEDVLNGEETGRDRKVRLGRLAAIERRSSSSATLFFADGEEMVLRGTNDVDSDNRGITIFDPGFGQVTVDWSNFNRLDFKPAPRTLAYDVFDGGHELEGTVYAEGGEQYTGTIRWDDDETHTWELLDGDWHEASFDIEFSKIKQIERKSLRTALVTTWDGREFRLSGTNDVDDDNRGIFVETKDGKEIELDWDEFDRVEFSR